MTQTDADAFFMARALDQARKSHEEGGLPIGAVMVLDDEVIGPGHDRRVQDGDPFAQGEMSCLRSAGRRPSYAGVTPYTTLSPCMMCSGTVVRFGIPWVVVGESRNFAGNIGFLRSHRAAPARLDRSPGIGRCGGRSVAAGGIAADRAMDHLADDFTRAGYGYIIRMHDHRTGPSGSGKTDEPLRRGQ